MAVHYSAGSRTKHVVLALAPAGTGNRVRVDEFSKWLKQLMPQVHHPGEKLQRKYRERIVEQLVLLIIDSYKVYKCPYVIKYALSMQNSDKILHIIHT